ASATPVESPTRVNTDRLCEGSDEWSSRRTPGMRPTASTIPAMTSERRPSLTFGTHSMSIPRAGYQGCDDSCCTSAIAFAILAADFMSEAHRHDIGHADDAPSPVDRDAKIEQLLLLGLDHYFAARYELAINVWTRALFIDRSHPRARLYRPRAQRARRAPARVRRAAAERGRRLSTRRVGRGPS